MKAKELIRQIRQAEKDTDNFYANRSGLWDLYFDLTENIEEGYIEGIKRIWRPKNDCLDILCEDGLLSITKGDGTLTYDMQESRKRSCGSYIRPTRMSPYERTRAMVYASGNKWAIENFNATH